MTESHYQAGKSRKKLQIEALAVVLSVYALLAVLFRYQAPNPPTVVREVKSSTLLDLSDVNLVKPEFLTWMEYHDPALFIRPDRVNGYGAWGALRMEQRGPAPSRASRPLERALPWSQTPGLAVVPTVPSDWDAMVQPPVWLIDAPPAPVAQRYPQISFNGQPLQHEVPPELAEKAKKWKLTRSRIVLSAPVAPGLEPRWDLSEAGNGGKEWRQELYRQLKTELEAAARHEPGEVLIQWRPAEDTL